MANQGLQVVCVAAGASESSFAGLLGWGGRFGVWVSLERGIGPVAVFVQTSEEASLGQPEDADEVLARLLWIWECCS